MTDEIRNPVELTEEQFLSLQKLLEEADEITQVVEKDRRWRWAATTLRNVAAWIAGLIAAGYAIAEFFGKTIRELLK